MPPLTDIPPRRRRSLSLCILGDPQIMLSAPRLPAFLFSRGKTGSPGLYHSQAWGLQKLQSLSPASCKNFQNSVPLISPVNVFGEMFSLCNTLCAPLSFLPFSVTVAALILFLLKPLLLTSYLLQSSLFSPSSCPVCSVSPWVDFLTI